MSLKKKAKQIKADIPIVFIAFKDRKMPLLPKIMAGITIAYALSPLDLIPDFIPVLGYLDDIILLPLLIALTVKMIPDEIWSRSKEKAENLWVNGKPKKWYYAVPIVFVWILVLWLIIKIFFI